MINENFLNTEVIYDKQDNFYAFWEKLVKKFRNVCLRWNFASRLILICWIRWWCSLFMFWIENTFFREIWSKKQNCLFNTKFWIYNHFYNILILFDGLPNFFSPQVKWCAIITFNHGISELPQKLPNDLRLRILIISWNILQIIFISA